MIKAGAIRVVIAEDIKETRDLIERLLVMQRYVVAGTAADGLQAVEVTRATRPDVVLMDISMPGIDGIEATRRILANCPTPVVILSVYKEPDMVRRASAAGAGAYLVKPPSIDELERAIMVSMARFDDMVALRQANGRLQVEVAARREAEALLQRRLEVEQFVAGISTAFVQRPSTELDEEINRALAKIGELAGADGVFFFSLSSNGGQMGLAHEWHRAERGSRINAMAQADTGILASWADRLATREPIDVLDVAALPEHEQRDLNPPPCLPARSLVAVPLLLADSWHTVLGIESVAARRAWGAAEVSLLTLVGQIIVAALERRQVEEKLAEADRMAFVAHMARDIAHEMRNPFSIIAINSDLLHKHADDHVLSAECARRIASATQRASLALDRLLGVVATQGGEDKADETGDWKGKSHGSSRDSGNR